MKEVKDESGYFKGLHQFRKSISDGELKEFSVLKNDAQRFKFARERNRVEFTVTPSPSKNLQQALECKADGNKLFQEGKYANALQLYSQSLLMYPVDSDKIELSIIRANRSAALYHLEEFENSLSDIEIALSLGYPKHLRYKIIDRRARCLMGLKQNQSAVQVLRDTITSLDDAKIPAEERQKKQRDIQIMLEIMKKNKVVDDGKNQKPNTESKILSAKNPKYTAASGSVTFGFSEGEGRFAEASTHLQSGETILREKAHCAVLLQENAETHCFHCMKRVYFPEPCPSCVIVKFCSRRCQESAMETHHRVECPVLKTLWGSGASVTCLMALRIISQRPLTYFLGIENKLKEDNQIGSDRKYEGSDYLTVYNLVRHEAKRSAEDKLHRSYMALFLFTCLKTSGYFNVEGLDEDVKTHAEELVGSLLLRHLQALQFNAHEISELLLKSKDPQTWSSVFVGGGLFPTLALFNHSCEPSVIRYFEGSKVVVKTIKSVKVGEKIFENYGPIFTQTPKKERQVTLKEQYWFDCACEPCTSDWPLISQMDGSTMRFHCENSECDNVVVVPVNTVNFMAQCNKCNTIVNILKGLKVLQDTDSLFRLGTGLMQIGDLLKALKKFLELQTLLTDTLVPPFKDFYLCQQNVRSCMMTLGNTHPPLSKFVKMVSTQK